ncbi:hypothetical protein AC1031_012735 [Aphanomyces cochlioides]|nr:hypothetical protein AC1031_012735 [Aphanomyces cochlioides]
MKSSAPLGAASLAQVRRFLSSLNLSYTASLTVDHRYRHIVHATFGKPRPDTPCPLAVVHVKFALKDDLREIASYEIENERHIHRLRDNIEFDERLLDRVIARKIALKRSGLIDLSDDYTRSRVQEPKYEAKGEDAAAIDPTTIKLQLLQMFETYDRNHDGNISYVEFREALRSGPLREDLVELLFTQADSDHNGCVNYEEFAKSAVEILSRMPRGYKTAFHGLYDDYLDYFHQECSATMAILNQTFEAADYLPPNAKERPKAHKLSYETFRKCLASPLANLSREEINLAISLVPMDADGKLDYTGFDKVLAKALFCIAQGQSLALAVDIEGYLVSVFEATERDWDIEAVNLKGVLPRNILFDALHRLKKLMLSKGQIMLLVGHAKENADGLVEYRPFATTAAGLIRQFINPRNVAKRVQICKSDVMTVASIFNGVSERSLERILLAAFHEEDHDNDGVLDLVEFQAAMRHTSLRLTDEEILSLQAVADANGDGCVDYEEFSFFAVHHLVQLKRQKMLHMVAESKDDDDDDANGAKDDKQEKK